MIAKGRHAKGARHGLNTHPECRRPGEKSPTAKMTDAKVILLRKEWSSGGRMLKDLATEFGISSATASEIVNGKLWKHIPMESP
jgi:hypothetical protein